MIVGRGRSVVQADLVEAALVLDVGHADGVVGEQDQRGLGPGKAASEDDRSVPSHAARGALPDADVPGPIPRPSLRRGEDGAGPVAGAPDVGRRARFGIRGREDGVRVRPRGDVLVGRGGADEPARLGGRGGLEGGHGIAGGIEVEEPGENAGRACLVPGQPETRELSGQPPGLAGLAGEAGFPFREGRALATRGGLAGFRGPDHDEDGRDENGRDQLLFQKTVPHDDISSLWL